MANVNIFSFIIFSFRCSLNSYSFTAIGATYTWHGFIVLYSLGPDILQNNRRGFLNPTVAQTFQDKPRLLLKLKRYQPINAVNWGGSSCIR